jgi:flavin reductase (DIM6/NTAB) family NADH-FMN oxidoreductase RutF
MRKSQTNALGRPPILWVALGRQRVGKTVLLNTAVQYFRGLGNPIRVWNADQQNRTHTLSVFFPDAEEIGGGGIEDSVAWMEARIEDQIAKGNPPCN